MNESIKVRNIKLVCFSFNIIEYISNIVASVFKESDRVDFFEFIPNTF